MFCCNCVFVGTRVLIARPCGCPLQIFALKDSYCNVLCKATYDVEEVKKFVKKIDNQYNVNWYVDDLLARRASVSEVTRCLCRMLDNLPAAATGITTDGSILYSHGFPVGGRELDTDAVFVYNHVNMTIHYHLSKEYTGARIVGFEVHPMRYVYLRVILGVSVVPMYHWPGLRVVL
jgi:hypothetical protein